VQDARIVLASQPQARLSTSSQYPSKRGWHGGDAVMPLVRDAVIGVFDNPLAAERAIQKLRSVGFRADQIGVAFRDGDTTAQLTAPEGATVAEGGAAIGAVAGGLSGALLGALMMGLIPGIGWVLAGGILAGIVGGGVIGTTAGGFVGALLGLDFSEAEVQLYENELKAGHSVVLVKTNGRYTEAITILRLHGAYDASYAKRTPEGTTTR
jgi:hypothetical protein